MRRNVMLACVLVLFLNIQLYQTHNIEQKTDSSYGLLVHLMGSVVRNTEKIKTLENKLEMHSEKQDADSEPAIDGINTEKIKELETKLSREQEKQDENLKKIISQLKEKHAENVIDLEQKLKNQQENHLDELKKVKSQLEDLAYKLRKQQENDEKDQKTHAEDIQKIKSDHDHEIQMLKGSFRVCNSPVVGFHVALDRQQSSGGKVAFNRVLSNYGNGWNSITHTFTVPTKGLYFFTLTVMNHGDSRAWAKLMHELRVLQAAYATSGANLNMGTTSTVLLLDAGEQIYAQHGAGTIYSNGYLYTHLAGFLIQKVN